MTIEQLAANYRAAYAAYNGVEPKTSCIGDCIKVVNHRGASLLFTRKDIRNSTRALILLAGKAER